MPLNSNYSDNIKGLLNPFNFLKKKTVPAAPPALFNSVSPNLPQLQQPSTNPALKISAPSQTFSPQAIPQVKPTTTIPNLTNFKNPNADFFNSPQFKQNQTTTPTASNQPAVSSETTESPITVPPIPPEFQKLINNLNTLSETASKISPEELTTQADLDKLLEKAANVKQSAKLGSENIEEQTIPMEFITGQKRELENRATNLLTGLSAQAEPLERKLARMQVSRQASLEASKFALEKADKTREEAEKIREFNLTQEKPITVGPGETVINQKTGKTVFTAPPKTLTTEEAALKKSETEYYKTRGIVSPEEKRLKEAQTKYYEKRAATTETGDTSAISDKTINFFSDVAMSGVDINKLIPSFGFGSKGVKDKEKFIEGITKKAEILGISGSDFAAMVVDSRSAQKGYEYLKKQGKMTEVNESNAKKNFDKIISLAEKMDENSFRVASAALNRIIQTGEIQLTSDENVNNFQSALYEGLTEYAKVVSGQTTGAGIHQHANEQVQKLLDRGLSVKAIKSFVNDVANPLMKNRISSYDSNLKGLFSNISNLSKSKGGLGENETKLSDEEAYQLYIKSKQ